MTDFSISHRVASYECGADLLMKGEWFMLHCQEMAELHASDNNFGYGRAFEQGLAWVEVRGVFEFIRRPRWKEVVRLCTNTGEASRLQAFRFVDMADESGELIARAGLRWVLINRETRRPVSLKRAGLSLPAMQVPLMRDPESLSDAESFTSHLVTPRRDIDFNGHINNSAYLTWVSDSLPKPPGMSLRRIFVSYKHESTDGEVLLIKHRVCGTKSEHIIEGGGVVRAHLFLEWS